MEKVKSKVKVHICNQDSINLGYVDYLQKQVGKRKIKDFLIWAFGKELDDTACISDILFLWEKNHPKIDLSWDDDIFYSMHRMIDSYERN